MRLTPSREQQDILDLGLGTIRIRAGAGTGKTTTVAMVISNLIEEHGIEPEQILGITFTNKAAAELADKVRSTVEGSVDEGRQVEVHTYHGFAAQVLSEFGALVGVDVGVKVITPTFSRQLLAETFDHTTYAHLDITNRQTLDKVRTLGDRLGDHLLEPAELIAAGGDGSDIWRKRLEMLETLDAYAADKRRLGVVDYADLVTLSTRVMQEHAALAAQVRDRYRVVVLDEYQDTNPGQRVLLTTIFGGGFPVIAVGDEDQTIYEWRGASSENFEQFPSHFAPLPGGEVHDMDLTLNRRSAQPILDVANVIRRRASPEAEELHAVDPKMPGRVITYWSTDAIAEADWIAGQLEEHRLAGVPWSQMAVLFRKNKDFAVVLDALSRHDIPVEVANLGGLLSVPEVAELRAWLTIIDRPEDSGALVQVLFGSRYRLGLADIAPLSKWVARGERDMDNEEVAPVSLLEAVESLDLIEGLRDGARQALDHFLRAYRELLIESQGMSLVEVCRFVLDRIRAWQDIEALPAVPRLTARLNLHRLLDLAEDWSPLSGRPSLSTFLDYLSLMEEEPAEELDSAHLSGEEAVTLVTIHRAKGLEWEVVAIPAVYDKNFPSGARQYPNPTSFPEHLPVAFRIDTSLDGLPTDEEPAKAFLRERHELQEWRTAYVAATRAKSILMVTGSYWYGLPEPNMTAKQPSALFDLVESHSATENAGHVDEPPRPAILRWAEGVAAPDPIFADGWADALRRAIAEPDSIEALAESLGVTAAYRAKVDEQSATLFRLADIESFDDGAPPAKQVSVTSLVTYAQCPKRFYWSSVDPLPRRRNLAAAAGTEVHRRIELHQRGQVPFDEVVEGLYDLPEGTEARAGAFENFLGSRFAERNATLVEAPFEIRSDNGFVIRGRMDAVYIEDGEWEVVDFKSGKPADEAGRIVQLQAYAVAATDADLGHPKPTSLDVTFAYLGDGVTEQRFHADEPWMEQARADLAGLTNGIDRGAFAEVPGGWCSSCDFLKFCAPGKAWLEG